MSLILTRRIGESIEFSFFGELVKIKISSIDKRGRVSLMIDAPKEIVILREEVAIRNENRGNRHEI